MIQWLATRLPSPVKRALGPIVRRTIRRPPPYEPDVQRLLRRLVRPGWTCADVGAYQGVLTRVMAKRAGETGRVVAFEAHPDSAALLADALDREGYAGRVRVEHLAVADGAGRAALYAGRPRSGGEFNLLGHDVSGVATEQVATVPTVALDDYFAGQHVDLVKIDVEGAEGRVFAGMRRLLAEDRPHVIVEFHGDEAWRERRQLTDAGYVLLTLDGIEVPPSSPRMYQVYARPEGA